MWSRERNFVELDEFFADPPARNVEYGEGSGAVPWLSSLVAFVMIVVLVPVALVMPVAFTVSAATAEAQQAWDALEAPLPPLPAALPGYTHVYASDGTLIAQFYAENRVAVTYDEISPHLIEAIVAIEDRRFWEHHGVDGEAVLRAARANLSAGQTVQGASTLTQQLVENLRLLAATTDAERDAAKAQTVAGKIVEGKTALELEELLSKEEILEAYLNLVYFGAGSYGVGAAADRFFGVSASELTVSQAALIAGMVREPSGLDPFTNPERAKNRRDTVLAAMRDVGYLSAEEAAAAMAEPVDVSQGHQPQNSCAQSTYPFYCAIVRELLLDDLRLGYTERQREESLYRGHLDVHTALDPAAMRAVDESIAEALEDSNRVATAVVVIEPGTGLVRAVGQNRQWGQDEGQTEIPYAMSAFQPGSTFKPVVLATALEQGFDLDTRMPTRSGFKPSGFDYPEGGFDNYASANYGWLTAWDATRRSSNVWYTRLITETGVQEAASMAVEMGATSIRPETISARSAAFALGAWEVSPLEMASIYATIAAAGSSCAPVFITDIVDTVSGDSLTHQRTSCHNAYSSTTASALMDTLQAPFARGGTADDFPLGDRAAIGKTGTTNGHAAAWFVGATPQYATAVWLGDPRGGQAHPLEDVHAYGRTYDQVFGADISGPLWNAVMTRLHPDLPPVAFDQVRQQDHDAAPASVSDLMPTVDVTGMGLEQAVALLADAGYTVIIDTEPVPHAPAGSVGACSIQGPVAVIRPGGGTDDARVEAAIAAAAGGDS